MNRLMVITYVVGSATYVKKKTQKNPKPKKTPHQTKKQQIFVPMSILLRKTWFTCAIILINVQSGTFLKT